MKFDVDFELDGENSSSSEMETKRLASLLSLDEPSSELKRDKTEEYYERRISEREKRINKARYASRAWAQQVLQLDYEQYRSPNGMSKDSFLHTLYWYLRYQVANKYLGPLPHDVEETWSLMSDARVPNDAHDLITEAWLKLKDKIDDYRPRSDKDGKKVLLANWVNVVLLNQGRDKAKSQRREEFRNVGIVDDVTELGPGTLTSDRISFLDGALPKAEAEISKYAGYNWGDPTLMSYVARYLYLLKTDLKNAYPDYATILHAIIYTKDVYTETGKVNIAELARRLRSGEFAQIDPENPIRLRLSEKAVRTRVDAVRALFERLVRHVLNEQEQAKVDAAIKRGVVYTPQNFDDPGVFERARKRLMKTKADHEFKPHLPTEKGPAKADEIDPEALELNGRWIYRIRAKEIDPNDYLGGIDNDQ